MFEKDLRDMCHIVPTKVETLEENKKQLERFFKFGGKITQVPIGVSRASLGNETCFRQKELNRARARNGGKAPRAINKTKLEDL